MIEWKGTQGNNFWVGRDGEKPVAIVNHCMSKGSDGTRATLASCAGWFANSNSEVSAHFGVGKDGRVWQFVKVNDTAWANGILEKPDLKLPWLADAVARKVNPNRLTISIEHEGDSFDTMSNNQFYASLGLHRFLIATYGIIPDRQHIIGHYQITGQSRSNCPGPFYPFGRLMQELKYNPNPNGYSIGAGVLQKLIEHSDQAATDEIYFTNNSPGQPHQLSKTQTKTGHIILSEQNIGADNMAQWVTNYY